MSESESTKRRNAGHPHLRPFWRERPQLSRSGQVYNGTRGPLGSAFTGATTEHAMANSAYNALETTFRHTSGRLQFLASYTYSKSLDQSSSLAGQINPLNYALSRAPSAFDIAQNFVGSYNYELPFDQLFHRTNRFTTGWALAGIIRFSSGFPVTLFNNGDTSLLGTQPNGVNNYRVELPDYTPGPLNLNGNPRNGLPYFSTSLFGVPPLGSTGTAAHRFFYGPGMENFDIALLKNLRITESRSLQFRLETFNTFNHAQFFGAGAVNGVIGTSSFGSVVSADSCSWLPNSPSERQNRVTRIQTPPYYLRRCNRIDIGAPKDKGPDQNS